MKCLILAGGFGTRLYPKTIKQAKGLLEYRGKPLLSHIVEKVPMEIDILVATNRRFEADFQGWRNGAKRLVEICIEEAESEQQKMGAVSSINHWIKQKGISEDLLVIGVDNYFEYQVSDFIGEYDGKSTLIAVYDIGDEGQARDFGVVRLEGDKITELEEKPAQPRSTIVATACYIFPPRVFPKCADYCARGKQDRLGDFIMYLIDTDEVRGFIFTELWFDAGSRPDLSSSQ